MNDDPTKPIALMVAGIVIAAIFVVIAGIFVAFIVGSSSHVDRDEWGDILSVAGLGVPGIALGLWLFRKGLRLRRTFESPKL